MKKKERTAMRIKLEYTKLLNSLCGVRLSLALMKTLNSIWYLTDGSHAILQAVRELAPN
jgi:hypothetical protein